MNLEKAQHMKDVFYITALSLVVVAGCATPLGKFNKKEAVVQNIERQQPKEIKKQFQDQK